MVREEQVNFIGIIFVGYLHSTTNSEKIKQQYLNIHALAFEHSCSSARHYLVDKVELLNYLTTSKNVRNMSVIR